MDGFRVKFNGFVAIIDEVEVEGLGSCVIPTLHSGGTSACWDKGGSTGIHRPCCAVWPLAWILFAQIHVLFCGDSRLNCCWCVHNFVCFFTICGDLLLVLQAECI